MKIIDIQYKENTETKEKTMDLILFDGRDTVKKQNIEEDVNSDPEPFDTAWSFQGL